MRRRVALVLTVMALALLLASGVAWAVNKVGTNGPDTLTGTNGDDYLTGNGGDELVSLDGRDKLLGGPGNDCLLCVSEKKFRPFQGDKNLLGGPGNDFVWAGEGADNVDGGEGNDHLSDDTDRSYPQDDFSGGPGDDVIDVLQYPSASDQVVCGGGFDWVAADQNDVVAPDCEKVEVFRGGTPKEFDDFWMFFYEKVVPQDFYEGLPPCHCRIFDYCGRIIGEASPPIHGPPPDVGV